MRMKVKIKRYVAIFMASLLFFLSVDVGSLMQLAQAAGNVTLVVGDYSTEEMRGGSTQSVSIQAIGEEGSPAYISFGGVNHIKVTSSDETVATGTVNPGNVINNEVTGDPLGQEGRVIITAHAAGTATITVNYYVDASVAGDPEKEELLASQTIQVRVGLTINSTLLNKFQDKIIPANDLLIGNDTITLANMTNASNNASAENQVVWSSSNPTVAKIVKVSGSDVLKLEGGGTAKITASVRGVEPKSFDVTIQGVFTRDDGDDVYDPIKDSLTLRYGVYYPLHTNAAAGRNLFYVSDDETKVAIDENGQALANYAGLTKIHLSALKDEDGNLVEEAGDSINVRVPFQIITTTNAVAVNNEIKFMVNTDSSAVTWTSSNPDVLQYMGDGIFIAKKKGRATIQATLDDLTLFPGEDVQKDSVEIEVIDSFALSHSEYTLNIGETLDLQGIVTQADADVEWEVTNTYSGDKDNQLVDYVIDPENKSIAITALSKGNYASVTVRGWQVINGQRTMSAECIITIRVPVTSVYVEEKDVYIDVGESKYLIYNLIFDEDPSQLPDDLRVEWTSSDPDVASIRANQTNAGINYYVRGEQGGSAKLIVRSIDSGVVNTVNVYVRQPVEEMDIKDAATANILNDVTVQKRMDEEKYYVTAVIYPEKDNSKFYDGINREIVWRSSDTNIATVESNENGICQINFQNPGKVTITATPRDPGATEYQKSCIIVVEQPPEEILLSTEHLILHKGEEHRRLVDVILEPEDVYLMEGVQAYEWVFSEEAKDIVTIDNDGYFVGTAVGTGIVTCRSTYDPGTVYKEMRVTVYQNSESISFPEETINTTVGTNIVLKPIILPTDTTNKNVTYVVEDTKGRETNCAVIEDGIFKAKAPGTVIVRATTQDTGIYAECKIIITQPVLSMTMPAEKNVKLGTSFTLTPTVYPSNASNKLIAWSSTDPSVATVNSSGKVTTKKVGSTYIVAKAIDTTSGFEVSARCRVSVQSGVTGIKLNKKNIKIKKGTTYTKLKATVSPSNAFNKTVTFVSSNPKVVKIQNKATGVFRGMRGGKATITAITNDGGKTAKCKVTVTEKMTSVKITNAKKYINFGATKKLKTKVKTAYVTNKKLKWSTSNSYNISVNQSGRIRALHYGRAKIQVASTDGSGKKNSKVIRVIRPVKKIKLNKKKATILDIQTLQLKATVLPRNATIKGVKWSSSNTSVATVDFNGLVTPVRPGTCKIVVTSTDGNNVKAVCKLTVKEGIPAESITINSKDITLTPGQSRALTARMLPHNVTEEVTWISGDTSVARVNKKGVVTAVGQGNTEIYAYSSFTGLEATCVVNVIAMNASYVELEQYDHYELDVFGSTENIKWYSNNERVATVSNGTVTARRPGSTVITAKVNGKTLRCRIVVYRLQRNQRN